MSQKATAADQDKRDGGGSLASTDADPLLPRDQPSEQEGGDQRGQREPEVELEPVDEESLNIPMPDPKWMFNNFLVDLADAIDDKELDKLKNLFLEIIGRQILEKITSVGDLFDHLRRRTILSRDNLACLQSMLMKLGRHDLIKKAIAYAQAAGDVIYFYPAIEPLNGYKPIKFHVEGKDFRNCTPAFLRKLRTVLSFWLCIPSDHVLIAGVEPSSSMLITVLVPEIYADIIEKMLQNQNEALQPLADLEIDTVQIGEKTYNMRGIEEAEVVETEQQTKLVNVYQQLQNKSRELESMEKEVMQLVEEQKGLKQQVDDLEMESVTLQTWFYTSESQPATLSSQASMVQFQESLNDVKAHDYDRNIIKRLLESNTLVMLNRARESYSHQLLQLGLQLQQMKIHAQSIASQIMPLEFELMFHRTYEGRDIEKILRDSLVRLFQAMNVPLQKQEQALTVYGNDILRKISHSLRYREKQKLEKKYTWNPDDNLTKTKDADQRLFLSVLFYKEMERKQGFVDFEQFVVECLKEVNRPDLVKKFYGILAKPPMRQQQQHQQQRQRSRTPSGASATKDVPQPVDEQLAGMGKEVHAIMEKVNWIEERITSAMSSGQTFDQPFGPKAFPGVGNFGFPYRTSDTAQTL